MSSDIESTINNIYAKSRIDLLDNLLHTMHKSDKLCVVEYYKGYISGKLDTLITEALIDVAVYKEYSTKLEDIYNQKKEMLK